MARTKVSNLSLSLENIDQRSKPPENRLVVKHLANNSQVKQLVNQHLYSNKTHQANHRPPVESKNPIDIVRVQLPSEKSVDIKNRPNFSFVNFRIPHQFLF
jgi:hypothetical protein